MRLLAILLLSLRPLAAWAGPPRVLADIGPTAVLVDGVMAGIGAAEALLPSGGDPHHFQLRPSQMRALSEAQAVFWIGPALTPWLAELLPGAAAQAVSVPLMAAEGVVARPAMFGGDGHDGSPDAALHASDPHIWLDPANQRAMTRAIAAALARLDPANATRYRANAGQVLRDLDAAEASARALLAPHATARLVVAHDGYAHFAAAFGVRIVAAIADSDAVAPGARHLLALRRQIAETGADCLFTEPQHGRAAAASLAADTGVRLGQLDPLGLAAAPAPGALLVAMAGAIDACLAGR